MTAVNRKKTLSKMAFASALAMFVAIAGLYLYNIVEWAHYPAFGFFFRTATGIGEVGVVMDHARQAGMQVGDRMLEVNGKSFATIEEFRAAMRRELGEQNTYLLERRGQVFQVTITNIPFGFRRSFADAGPPFLLGLCYALIGTLVFLMKPHQRTSWIFFLFGAIFGLFIMFLHRTGVMRPFWLENLTILTYVFAPATFIHLALSFPEERQFLRVYPVAQIFPYAASALLFLGVRSVTPTMTDTPTAWLIIVMAYMAAGVLLFLGSCVQLWRKSSSEIAKLRAKMILLGFGIAASLPLADFVINSLFDLYLVPTTTYYLPFFVVFPLFVGYSIVKHDLFDIDAIIKRTYGYVLTTGSIAGVYGLFVLVSNVAFGRFEVTKSPVFPLVFVLAVVFLFNPVRNRVQKFIDRVFYRLEYDYQDTVQSISETMRSLLNLEQIGKAMMDTALGAMFIDFGGVVLLNPNKKEYECLITAGAREKHLGVTGAQEELPAHQGLVETGSNEMESTQIQEHESSLRGVKLLANEPLIQKIAQKRKEVTIYDIEEDPFFEDERESCKKTFDRMEATLIVPLIYEDRLTGLMSLGRKKSGKFYRREDINLLNILANQGAVAVENAMMVEDVIEKERMEEELSIARDLQTSMLPASCPEIEGIEIAATSIQAREVGGDFFDFIEISERKVGLVIGDVTGKSVSGALVMSASRSVFRMLSEGELPVAEIMDRANRRTKKDIKRGMFVALLYAVLDAEEKTLSLCSAGQTLPVYLPAVSGEARLVATEGDTFPLGILEDAEYQETTLQLAPGDKVILYTDGIVEAMNEQEDIFGFERLLEVVQIAGSMSAESLLKEIIDEVSKYVGGAAQHDDLTVIVLSVTE